MTEEQLNNLIESINVVEDERLAVLFDADELEEAINRMSNRIKHIYNS